MAEPVNTTFANAQLDAKTLEKFVNGSDTENALPRLSAPYPTLKKAIKQMFENGGLPSVPFINKETMINSLLPNDSYAVVTQDSVPRNNGYYQKIAGTWTYLKWNPLISTASKFNENDDLSAQNALNITNYLKDIRVDPLGLPTISEKLSLNAFTGVADPRLISGYVDANYNLTNDGVSRSVSFDIPENVNRIDSFILKTPVHFAVIDSLSQLVVGGFTSDVNNLAIPFSAKKIIFTVGFSDPSKNQDFLTGGVILSKPNLKYFGNKVLRVSDTVKPIVRSETFLLSSLPSYANAVSIGNASTAAIPETLIGSTFDYGYIPTTDGFTAKIPIPDGAKSYKCLLSSYQYIALANKDLIGFEVNIASDKLNLLPAESKFLILGLKNKSAAVDMRLDSVIFYFDDFGYALSDTSGRELIKSDAVANSGMIMLANTQYNIEGFDFRLYTESLFSGYSPTKNYSIETVGNELGVVKDRGAFVNVLTAGKATVSVYDAHRNLVDRKTTNIIEKPMPTSINAGFSAENPLQVLFIGDSLIWLNSNKIGEEWLRMLNTEQVAKTVGDVFYPTTYNLGNGNIKLVGTKSTEDSKYELGNTLHDLLTYGAFYDASSSEPNELDSDGWNKRVNIPKYLQEICGQGKYPRYIYIACGVNDIVDMGWDINKLPLIRNKMRTVLGGIKKACDIIAGGESNVQILLMNHQFYPLHEGAYHDYYPARQRLVWAEHYKQYEKMVNEESVNGKRLNTYVRFVDCASSFDVDHGYSYEQMTINPRSVTNTNLVIDTVHMSDAGACMYADALLRDFLYHECS